MKPNWSELIESPLVLSMLNEAGRLGVPSRDEERSLITKAQAGCRQSRDDLHTRHSPFVVSEVKKMGGWGMDYLDLFQEAMIGLDRAIDRFDTEKYPIRFISYAVWWMRQQMLIAAQNAAGAIRVPVNRHTDLLKVRKMVKAGRSPTAREVMRICKVTNDVARALIDAAAAPVSLQDFTHTGSDTDDGLEVGDLLPAPFNDDVADESEARWAVRLIEQDQKMTAKEKYIIVQRLYIGRSLDDIGLEMGVSRERIRQIQKVAMARVQRIAAEYDERCGFTAGDRRSMLSMGG